MYVYTQQHQICGNGSLHACGERLIHFNGGLFLADEVALQQAVKQNDVHDRHNSKSDAAEAIEHKGD